MLIVICPSRARYAIPIVAASELGPALNSALINLYSRTRLEWPAKDGESPVDEIFIEYSLFPAHLLVSKRALRASGCEASLTERCAGKYDRTREIRSEECVSASERTGGSSSKATYSP